MNGHPIDFRENSVEIMLKTKLINSNQSHFALVIRFEDGGLLFITIRSCGDYFIEDSDLIK